MSLKTNSEELFEHFLAENNVRFEKLKEDTTARPDYLAHLDGLDLIIEVKELEEDEKFGVVADPSHPHIKNHSRTIGDHVRKRIDGARKQIQYGANLGLPSILLIYNNIDPVFQAFGTEDMDFVTAMYGEMTMLINPRTNENSELFNGRNQLLQERKNTSFSAVGRLCNRGGRTTVTIFENIFAKIAVPYDGLPSFFEVQRAAVSTESLNWSRR